MPEGLIAIGVIALVAALFLLRSKEKTSQPKQQVVHKPAANQQTADLARPSAPRKTQATPFPVPQVPFPVSAANQQTVDLARPSTSPMTQLPFPGTQTPFPGSGAQASFPGTQTPFLGTQAPLFPTPRADQEAVTFAEPSVTTETLIQGSLPVQTPDMAQTSVWQIQTTHTPVEQSEPDQTLVPVALNGQLSAKPNHGLPEAQMPSSTPSEAVPSPSLNPVLRLLPNPPSIDQQMAELIADTWALQQQAAELGRRLNYLSTCIQHSQASTPYKSDANNRGEH